MLIARFSAFEAGEAVATDDPHVPFVESGVDPQVEVMDQRIYFVSDYMALAVSYYFRLGFLERL